MQIPEEHFKTINDLATLFGPKYKFGSYTNHDMIQEALCIGLEGYQRWDQSRPLVNFISKHISNRLKSFKRDNYFRPEGGSVKNQEAKKKLAESGNGEPCNIYISPSFINEIVNREYLETLDLLIPNDLRRIYLRMLDGAKINYIQRSKVVEFAKELLNGKG